MLQGCWWQATICYHIVCRFHDICLNHTSLEWQYYVDPEAVEVPLFYHYLNGHPVYEFSGRFCHDWACAYPALHAMGTQGVSPSYMVIQSPFQSSACRSHPCKYR